MSMQKWLHLAILLCLASAAGLVHSQDQGRPDTIAQLQTDNRLEWVTRVAGKVKSNIAGVANADAYDPAATGEFEVTLLPDGSVAGIRLLKSSGVPDFDSSVRRALEASAPYPPDKTGKIPHSFISTNRLRDKQP